MIRCICVFLCLLVLPGCVHIPKLPSSERLKIIHQEKLPEVKTKIEQAALVPGSPVFIRIFKQERELELWMRADYITKSGRLKKGHRYRLYHTYPICAFSGTLGPKLKEGDRQAPEGFYMVTRESLNPESQYHLSFDLGFPNAFDKAHGSTGSLLMVHGGCRSEGCFAMTDPKIEEIYMLVELALQRSSHVPVHIFPFRMTNNNMLAHQNHMWMPFWYNLKPGYDAFEDAYIPPLILHQNGRYKTARVLGL